MTSDAESCVTRRQSFRINGNFYKREETYRILEETKPPNKNDSLARGQIYNKYTRKYTYIYISEEQTAVKCLFLLAQLCWLVCIYVQCFKEHIQIETIKNILFLYLTINLGVYLK